MSWLPTSECEKLGVSRKATLDEVKQAFNKLALKHHPDKNMANQEESSRIFDEIRTAYNILRKILLNEPISSFSQLDVEETAQDEDDPTYTCGCGERVRLSQRPLHNTDCYIRVDKENYDRFQDTLSMKQLNEQFKERQKAERRKRRAAKKEMMRSPPLQPAPAVWVSFPGNEQPSNEAKCEVHTCPEQPDWWENIESSHAKNEQMISPHSATVATNFEVHQPGPNIVAPKPSWGNAVQQHPESRSLPCSLGVSESSLCDPSRSPVDFLTSASSLLQMPHAKCPAEDEIDKLWNQPCSLPGPEAVWVSCPLAPLSENTCSRNPVQEADPFITKAHNTQNTTWHTGLQHPYPEQQTYIPTVQFQVERKVSDCQVIPRPRDLADIPMLNKFKIVCGFPDEKQLDSGAFLGRFILYKFAEPTGWDACFLSSYKQTQHRTPSHPCRFVMESKLSASQSQVNDVNLNAADYGWNCSAKPGTWCLLDEM